MTDQDDPENLPEVVPHLTTRAQAEEQMRLRDIVEEGMGPSPFRLRGLREEQDPDHPDDPTKKVWIGVFSRKDDASED